MKCPKCKAAVGFRQVERTIIACNDTPGLSCFMCGYWFGILSLRRGEITLRLPYEHLPAGECSQQMP